MVVAQGRMDLGIRLLLGLLVVRHWALVLLLLPEAFPTSTVSRICSTLSPYSPR